MVRQSTRRTLPKMSHHEGNREAFTNARANQAPKYITRDEMETVMDAMQKMMLKKQEEMVQNLLRQIGQAKAQNQRNRVTGASGNLNQRVDAAGIVGNQNRKLKTELLDKEMEQSRHGQSPTILDGSVPISKDLGECLRV